MSSIAAAIIRALVGPAGLLGVAVLDSAPLAAQDGLANERAADRERTNPDGSTTIDILRDADEAFGPPPPMEDCSDEQEAAILSGEIIVCRRARDQREFRTMNDDDAQSRYARETMNQGNPQTPDVAGEGIFRGPATVSGLCVIPPCPKEPVLIIDVTALPQAPEGSDADRISRGLPPLGQDDEVERDEPDGLAPLRAGVALDDLFSSSVSEAPADPP